MTASHSTDISQEIVDLDLAGGLSICLRTIRPQDGALMREGISQMSDRSRYLRFFSGAVEQPDSVIENLLDVDGHSHIAWGAIDTSAPDSPAIGAVHALKPTHPVPDAELEFSVAVLDDWQQKGIARLLTAALLVNCQARGITTLEAYTLAENDKAVRFLKLLGASFAGADGNVLRFTFAVGGALDRLTSADHSDAMKRLLAQLSRHVDDA